MHKRTITFIDITGDHRAPGRGGTSDLVWLFARELSRQGHSVNVIGLYPRGSGIDRGDVNVVSVPPSRRRNIITHVWDVARVIRSAVRTDADIVHSMDSVTAGMLSLLPARTSTVFHGNMNVRSHRKRVRNLPWSRSMYALMSAGTAMACRRVARIVSLGPSLNAGWVETGADLDRIAVLPNPIATTTPLERTPEPATVLYVGRLSPEKGGVTELIHALSYLPESLRLIIAGDGPMRGELERNIRARGLRSRVEMLGQQPPTAVRSLYARATLVILPSVNEMLPRVMQEAWSAGVAFAGTPAGAIPDYLQDGVNGYLVPGIDPHAIANTIQRALGDPTGRKRIEDRARESVRTMSVGQITERLIREVYEPIIAKNEARSTRSTSSRTKRLKRVNQ